MYMILSDVKSGNYRIEGEYSALHNIMEIIRDSQTMTYAYIVDDNGKIVELADLVAYRAYLASGKI